MPICVRNGGTFFLEDRIPAIESWLHPCGRAAAPPCCCIKLPRGGYNEGRSRFLAGSSERVDARLQLVLVLHAAPHARGHVLS